jgi:enterochelin esterase-like enzyme
MLPIRYLLLIVLLLTASQSQAGVPVSASCTEPGYLESLEIETNTRSTDYNVEVYLPPCYGEESSRRYPALYLFPGRGGGPSSWFAAGLTQLVDELILSGEQPPLIIVGLEATDNDLYAETFDRDVFPYIQSHYRTLPQISTRALAGASQGGAPAYRLALRQPHRYGSAALFGSGAISGEEFQIETWLDKLPRHLRPRFFLNTGLQDPLMLERAHSLYAMLAEREVSTQVIFSTGDHSYAYWLENFPAYLAWLADAW